MHECEPPSNEIRSTLIFLVPEWERAGLDVQFAYGTRQELDADVVINHVDMTVVPDDYVDYMRRYPVAINGRLTDISKRLISRHLLESDDDHRGKVIVKTDANFGGVQDFELALAASDAPLLVREAKRWVYRYFARRVPGRATFLFSTRYPVFDSLRDVPDAIWSNPHLVVEKLQTEQGSDGNYILRAWTFLGGKSLHVMVTSPTPVVKGSTIVEREILPDDVPAALAELRESLGADYGRIDYVMVDGEAVIFDLNRTPTTTPAAHARYATKLREMAQGIYDYL